MEEDDNLNEIENSRLRRIAKWNIYQKKYHKERYHNDIDFKKRKIEASMKSRAKKPEMYKRKSREWRENNRKKLRKYMRDWQMNNREYSAEYMRDYRKNKKQKISIEKEEALINGQEFEKFQKEKEKEKDLNSSTS